MTPPTPEQVRGYVERFRPACEVVARTLDDDHWLGHFVGFPEGVCRDTACMLAEGLIRQFAIEPGQIKIASAWRNNGGTSHSWVVWDGWIIDITADQFPDCEQPVIFARSSAWHGIWTSPESEPYSQLDLSDLECDARWRELLRQIEVSMAAQ